MRGALRKAATYTQNNKDTEKTHTDIHASSGIRTHNPSVRTGEDSSCLQRDHYDRLKQGLGNFFTCYFEIYLSTPTLPP
jgi:hypothetical protein